MLVFAYDQSFDGLLTVIFEAFRRKEFPEALIGLGEAPPLLASRVEEVPVNPAHAERVWRGLEKKLSPLALRQFLYAWLTEEPAGAELALRYVRAVYAGVRETNFAHPDVLALRQTALKVSREKEHLRQFVRFQKTGDGVYFAAVRPLYNVLPLVTEHFADRFADQKWIIRDLARGFGFYYDTERVRELDFPPCAEGAPDPVNPATGQLEAAALADEEELWQEAWRGYFSAVAIDERANLRLQRQYMPQRFWPYLTEKQNSPPADENFVGKK